MAQLHTLGALAYFVFCAASAALICGTAG
jgi:hypothetical protein